jgi:hypothetical protein
MLAVIAVKSSFPKCIGYGPLTHLFWLPRHEEGKQGELRREGTKELKCTARVSLANALGHMHTKCRGNAHMQTYKYIGAGSPPLYHS